MPTLNGVLLLAPDHGEAENLACSFLLAPHRALHSGLISVRCLIKVTWWLWILPAAQMLAY